MNAATCVPGLLAAFSINDGPPVNFLVDTGASISILPPNVCVSENVHPSPLNLLSVDGTPLKIFGECSVTIGCRMLRRAYNVCFVVANVSQPILGIDFLSNHNIIVDCKNSMLVDAETGIRVSCEAARRTMPISFAIDGAPVEINNLLHKFPRILRPLQFPTGSTVSVEHHIETTTQRPIHFRPRQLPPEKFSAAQKAFAKLMEDGIIRHSKSEWASPLHMVQKPDKSWRPCGLSGAQHYHCAR